MIGTVPIYAPRVIILRPGESETITLAHHVFNGFCLSMNPTHEHLRIDHIHVGQDSIAMLVSHTAPTVPLAILDHMVSVHEGSDDPASLENAVELYLDEASVRLEKGALMAHAIMFERG